jgi:hypothetical protein
MLPTVAPLGERRGTLSREAFGAPPRPSRLPSRSAIADVHELRFDLLTARDHADMTPAQANYLPVLGPAASADGLRIGSGGTPAVNLQIVDFVLDVRQGIPTDRDRTRSTCPPLVSATLPGSENYSRYDNSTVN